MRSGLEVLVDDAGRLGGGSVGLVCNHTAVDRELRHAIDRLTHAGVRLVRLFGPEHGVRATAQDMIGVDDPKDPVSGLPVVSLYGASEASLRPDPATIADLDVILFDIQDIGARYYTYQATLGYVMEVAGRLGKRVVVLDRPNPIDGVSIEGNVVQPGFESFVGAYPLAVRHGMTVGELAMYFRAYCEVACDVEVIACEGWDRRQWLDETDLPWVFPSPNMPTLDTATVYPGTCLIEATNLSEGRGTTRPFHLIGAPWIDPERFAAACVAGAARAGLEGAAFRPHAFIPGFQKHARVPCGGIEIHVRDRRKLDAFLLGLVVTDAARRCDPERFAWRTEAYEFVVDPPAIDLLTGSALARQVIEAGGDLRELLATWKPELAGFAERRASCLLYGAA
jgi:uncharacterized protein YbbC (DUF1343 family)